MKHKTLLQVSVLVKLEAEEAVLELLGRIFNRPAAAYADAETKLTSVSVYCEQPREWNENRRAALAAGLRQIAASGLDAGTARISTRRLTARDWAESWKRHFKPIVIGSRLLIKPGWIKQRARPGQAVVVLDPGLSFGTGNHPTTGFCLRILAAARTKGRPQSFFDLGTGSGILAIAAAKLGYAPVKAVDFDPQAVRVARENASRNEVLDQIRLTRGDITRMPLASAEKHELICANLISDLLIAERRRIVNRVSANGTLVLAGILKAEFPQVQEAYETLGLRLIRARSEGEWRSGAFRR